MAGLFSTRTSSGGSKRISPNKSHKTAARNRSEKREERESSRRTAAAPTPTAIRVSGPGPDTVATPVRRVTGMAQADAEGTSPSAKYTASQSDSHASARERRADQRDRRQQERARLESEATASTPDNSADMPAGEDQPAETEETPTNSDTPTPDQTETPTTDTATDPVVSPSPNGSPRNGLNAREPLDDSVVSNFNEITKKDSNLMQQARTQGLQAANRRGLLNSSMAVDASQDAAFRVALPIASQDAQQKSQKNLAHQGFEQDQSLQDDRIIGDQQAGVSNMLTSMNSLYAGTIESINSNKDMSADARASAIEAAKNTLIKQTELVEQIYNITIEW